MKKAFLLIATVAALLAGCDHSQDIPEGASYKDPAGVAGKGAAPSGMAEQQAQGAQEQARRMQGRSGGR